jgi:hypothetical protein
MLIEPNGVVEGGGGWVLWSEPVVEVDCSCLHRNGKATNE